MNPHRPDPQDLSVKRPAYEVEMDERIFSTPPQQTHARNPSRDMELEPENTTTMNPQTRLLGREAEARIRKNSEAEDDDEEEVRLIPHKYVFRRPRALQYQYRSKIFTTGDQADGLKSSFVTGDSREPDEGSKKYDPEGLAKHRERLDLFIDLIWVGIITNITDLFAEKAFEAEGGSIGDATLLFILVFVPSWRIWNFLREFMNNYYMDDMVQRIFIFWILVLSIFYGNNIVYLIEDFDRVKTIIITVYLVIRSSFIFMELIYSIWIPWLRRLILIHFITAAPSAGFWIAAIFVKGGHAAGPAVVAMIWDYVTTIVMDSSISDRFVPGGYRKAVDANHFRSRMASFYIITVGEGVLQLVKEGPLGIGFTETAGPAIWALHLYFLLAFMYFTRDQSESYIPAVRRKGMRTICWVLCHLPLFGALLTLSAGIMFLIREHANKPGDEGKEALDEEELHFYIHRAIWVIAISMTTTIFSMTMIALLDKPTDPPGTLLVNNRYVRLFGRVLYIAIVLGVPAMKDIDLDLYLGIIALSLAIIFLWEWVASLERPAGFVEPKGLTVMMKRELSVA